MVDAARLEVAKKQLATVDVIGFSEQYTEFIEELRHRYGWWPEGLNTTARANESSEGWDVPAALRKRIAADNAYDVELCEFAHELVRERKSRAGAHEPTTVAVPPSGAAVETSKDEAKPAAGRAPAEAKPDATKSEAPRPAPHDLRAQIHARHPHFIEAVIADAKITAAMRSERSEFRGRKDALLQAVRLAWVSDAFLAQALYRAKARMQALGVPVLPRIAHRLAMMTAQICIGDPVVMRPGVYIAHGQVVIDGFVEIHTRRRDLSLGHHRPAGRQLPRSDDRTQCEHRYRREDHRPRDSAPRSEYRSQRGGGQRRARQYVGRRHQGAPDGRQAQALTGRDIAARKRSGHTGSMADGSSHVGLRTAAEIRSAQPKFVTAVLADAKVTAAYRSERFEFRGRADAAVQALRLAWRSDAFLAQVLYRAQAGLSARRVPILPRIAHRLAMLTAQLCIGESVLVHPGVYFAARPGGDRRCRRDTTRARS